MRFLTAATMACLMLASAPVAQADGLEHTRTADSTGDSTGARPKASIGDLAWLVGRWEGPGISGAPSQESWSTPLGGSMAGTFVQGDGKGGILFSEVMQIAADGESLVVRLKHFNADLTGWEEKDKMLRFPLFAREGDAWYFDGLTYRREGRGRLLVAVRMRGNDGKVSELVFRFRRVG